MTTETTSTRGVTLVDRIYQAAGLVTGEVAAPKRPNRRGEQTREKLIDAATACFTEYGYTRTRIADITHRADTAQGNFYRHFTSLDEIFLEALRPGLDALTAPLTGRSRTTDLESLTEVYTDYLHAYAKHRHILRLLREAAAASANGGFLQLWLGMRGQFVKQIRHWLGRLVDSDEIAEPVEGLDLLAESLGCLTEQMAYVHIGLPASTHRRERIDELGQAIGAMWFRALPRAHAGTVS